MSRLGRLPVLAVVRGAAPGSRRPSLDALAALDLLRGALRNWQEHSRLADLGGGIQRGIRSGRGLAAASAGAAAAAAGTALSRQRQSSPGGVRRRAGARASAFFLCGGPRRPRPHLNDFDDSPAPSRRYNGKGRMLAM
jgi:hypothetical protein